ncbi:short chain dehydrogenase [Nitratireductor indicus C115]|uniref:Short chain dehydrogenase n=1 Tax=Nitratireductor indicus C115 TaxID=1231190 RepID=K2PP69_9HYPH|nr:SDR family oxidoreductase [Nitratireductor indicus]EKF42882.1 short chain dehydrogenase [Nitratireductor indicus C115]SFQ41718.1 NAD(P)-dependent dehydrogenase, short-chain alcohol dehydrogenase family [Nitratireductor indicus]
MTEARKTALVTGGARRIGAAIARDLAANGFAIAIHYDSSSEAVETLVSEIIAAGGSAVPLQANLARSTDAAGLIGKAQAALGLPDIIVNNASVFEDDSVFDFDEAMWDKHFAVHLKAPALIAQALANTLPAGREALIVNMIDQRVWRLNPRFFSYTLSKSALWTATRTMAQALGPSIRVNAIGPGPTLPNQRQEQADFDRQTDALVLRRGPALEEFGRTVRYLWEARSVTGQMIALDGGQHLAWETPDIAGIPE